MRTGVRYDNTPLLKNIKKKISEVGTMCLVLFRRHPERKHHSILNKVSK